MEISADARWTGGRHDGRIAVVVSRFNDYITDGLLAGAVRRLESGGFPNDRIDVIRVPGALELPLAARTWIETRPDAEAVIALGCVIRGDTTHFDIVVNESCRQLADIGLDRGIPVLNGILACENMDQATARSGDDDRNKGVECATAALMMTGVLAGLE